MNTIGKSERTSQDRIIKLFQTELGYEYLGNWQDQERTQPVEEQLLFKFLTQNQGYSNVLANKAIHAFTQAVNNLSEGLYEANKKVYKLLRYGVTVKEELGKPNETVWLIDWKEIENNDFAVAEEVTVQGNHDKRPDIVIYINGIAVGVIELKRSKVGVEEGIRQNLDNQKPEFIQKFFTTMQLVMAGNDTQGLRYGTIETSEKYYLKWKEESTNEYDYILDKHVAQLCNKHRILELINDFIVFDKGTKKLSRPNQYFGVKAAQDNIATRTGGVIWMSQGSGKSLVMVWLAKWIRENVKDSRVLIITDREELDEQIEKLFVGVDEGIFRTKSGRELIQVLNEKKHSLIGSLVHKFGRKSEEGDFDSFIEEVKSNIATDFKAKGDVYVFVDECHRTQSGKLHDAMKMILPDSMFIGFTGTPLLKRDVKTSLEVFGPYIHTYKFDEAVDDNVVLDLRYEARDIDQRITDQESIDEWFDAETRGLNDLAKIELKKRWGTLKQVLSSKSRLVKVVNDIFKDFRVKPRLNSGEGNA